MANTHYSKAKVGQKSKKMEEKKVLPLSLAGIRTRDLKAETAALPTELSAQWRILDRNFSYLS